MRCLPPLIAVALAIAPRPVVAQVELEAKPGISPRRRALAIGAAIIPGVLVRGAGSWVRGERRTAGRLALIGGIGGGVALAAAIPLGLTFPTPRLATAAIPIIVVGGGAFVTTWISDIWAAAGGDAVAGTPGAAARWQLDAGTTLRFQPGLADDAYGRLGGAVNLGRWRLGAVGLVGLDADAQRGRIDAGWRVAGATATEIATGGDASHVEVRAAETVHRHGEEHFTTATTEVSVHARLDGARLAAALAGSFTEIELGFGLELVRYAHAATTDRNDLLVGRLGWGAYLGAGRGEAIAFYDHRRDGLAGGLPASRAAGFIGSVGAAAEVHVTDSWTAVAQLELGSAWVATAALRRRGGGP